MIDNQPLQSLIRLLRTALAGTREVCGLTAGQVRRLVAEIDSTVAPSLVVLIPSGKDHDLAQKYVANFATQLRGPDALHLAVAHNIMGWHSSPRWTMECYLPRRG